MTLQDYLEAAHAKLGTWNAVSKTLDVNRRTVMFWREKRGFPGEETMMNIAKAGGHDPVLALLRLSVWKAVPKSRVRKVWKRLVKERLKHQSED